MFKSVINKIANNIWLFVCLIIGSLMITAILASIPIYSDGALRKMMDTEMNEFQFREGQSPGQMYSYVNFENSSGKDINKRIEYARELILGGAKKNGLTLLESYERLSLRRLRDISPESTLTSTQNWKLESMTGFEDHITLIKGKMYSDKVSSDGVIEVIVSANEYNLYSVQLNREYTFVTGEFNPDYSHNIITVKVVGVYEPNYEDSDYWYDLEDGFEKALFASVDAFEDRVLNGKICEYLTNAGWFCNIDFHGMQLEDLPSFINFYDEINLYFEEYYTQGKAHIEMNFIETLTTYISKAKVLNLTLWILNAPVLVMLLFYLFMVSKLIIEEDKNEISALKSRGAKPKQIFGRYVIECGIIIFLSLLIGPPIGLVLAQLIGSANGFLEFVNRSSMNLTLLPESYMYAILAGIAFLILVLIPAYIATKKTIVQHKHEQARKKGQLTWFWILCEFLLLAASIYLLIMYKRSGVADESGELMDPFVYFISTMFILACGLIFLRIYPIILKIIFALTRKIMPPTMYSTFIQVSRTGNDSKFLILFLILTLSIGIYSASSARIINSDVEDTASYKNGADLTVEFNWEKEDGSRADILAEEFQLVEGIENVTKVVNIDSVQVNNELSLSLHERVRGVRLMAIEPYYFTKVAWYRPSLTLDMTGDNVMHWYHYINVMQESPTSILISRELADMAEVVVGSTMQVTITPDIITSENKPITFDCYVLGYIDYWPTYYEGAVATDVINQMVVMNMAYLESVMGNVDFDLWVDIEDGYTETDIYENFEEVGLLENVSALNARTTKLNEGKRDSLVMALNGSFSLGFVATMAISFVGFLVYWIMNIRKRKLQFGILRAMGFTKFKLTLMLIWEHLLTTGVAIAVGFGIGVLTVSLFQPLLEMTYSSLLPLRLVYAASDFIRVLVISLIMVLVGVIVLAVFIRKLKINEAVKIGED